MRPHRVVLLGVLLALSIAPLHVLAQEPSRADGWVVIPVEDYRSLRARAYPTEPIPAPPPVDAALTRLTYDLTLAGDSVTGSATAEVDVLKDGWVDVLIPAGLLVRDARVDGRPVSLIDQPSPHVLLSKRGRSELTLQIVLPVTPAGAAESVVIPPAPAALVEASLQIPRDGVQMSVANGFVSGQNQNAGATRWTAYGRANEPLTFLWRRRVDDQRAGQPLRLRGSVVSLVGLAEDSTQITATVQVDVMQGLARSVTLAVPSSMSINQVSGPLVGDWDTAGGALRIAFLEPVASATTISISGDVRGPHDGIVPVPLVRIPDAERETGGIAVEVLGAGEIVERQPQALDPADATDLGSIIRGRESPSLVAFRYKPLTGRDPRALAVKVSRYATQAMQVANVDEARYQVLIAEDGKSMVKARYAVRNNHRGLLTVALPANATLWQASVAGRPVRPGRSTTGALLVPLEKARTRDDDLPPFVVEIVYVAPTASWGERGAEELTLPALDLPVSRTGVELHYSPRFRVTSTMGPFRVEPYASPFSAALTENEVSLRVAQVANAPAAPSLADKDEGAAAMKELVKQYQLAAGGRLVAGVLPVQVPFPEFGAVLFLASELTPEARAPKLPLEYQRERGN